MSDTILDKIKAYKLEEVAADKARIPLSEIEADAQNASSPRNFYERLLTASKTGYGLIAEIKKASPSKGLIREDFDPTRFSQLKGGAGDACELLSCNLVSSYQPGVDWKSTKIDDEAYCMYEQNYIKKPGTPNQLVWEMVADDLVNGLPTKSGF